MNNTEYLLRTSLLYLAHIAIFALSLRVYLRRREGGFLCLTVALGLQAFMALIGLVSLFSVFNLVQLQYAAFHRVMNLSPLILALAGWTLLGRKKN